MALVISPEVAANLRARGEYDFAKIAPQRLSDGRYAISEGTLTDRRFARQRPLLLAGTIEPTEGLSFANSDEIRLTIDGKLTYLTAASKAHSFGIPSPGVHRFEVRHDESGYSGDARNGNRRSELVAGFAGDRYSAGETLWVAFHWAIGVGSGGFQAGGLPLNLLCQWHSVDVETSRSPIFGIGFKDGNFGISTRSDATGTEAINHFSMPVPAAGTLHHTVVAGKLGQQGHLRVWQDGQQVVSKETPIGYYNDDGGARALAYVHFGMYQNNIGVPTIVYTANERWGTTDLSGMVAAPTPVSVPPGGWV